MSPLLFAVERLADCWDDFIKLAQSHWEETQLHPRGKPLNPDKNRYLKAEADGWFIFCTARDGRKLVGHLGFYLTPSMHTQSLTATEDYWFILPEYRRGRNAIDLYLFAEHEIVRRGGQEIEATLPIAKSGKLLSYFGFKPVAQHYWKSLVDKEPRYV